MSNCSSEGDQPGNRPACAACKHQRKRCPENCLMAPHFPAELKEEFMRVHRVFGLSNVTKMIKGLDFRQQKEAIKSFIFEANQWTKDPVHGPLKEVEELKQQVSDLRKQLVNRRQLLDNRSSLLIEGSGDNQFVLEPLTVDINPAAPVLFQERPLFMDGIGAVIAPSHHQSNLVLQGRNFHGLNPNPSFVQEQARPSSGIYSDRFIQPANHHNSQLRRSFSRSVVLVQEQERLISTGERARITPSSHQYQEPFVQERQSNGGLAIDVYQASTQRLQNNINGGYGHGGGPATRRLVHDGETASVHAAGSFHGQAAGAGMHGHQRPWDTWNFAE